MHTILSNEVIAPQVLQMVVEAPEVARYRKAGQFVMVRPIPQAERIPLTIADADAQAGTITLVYQIVGVTTSHLASLKATQQVHDIAGPLGQATHIAKYGTVVAIGGGIGTAPLYPIAKALNEAGNRIISIIGARSKDLLILQPQITALSEETLVTTDDGSAGTKGLVTNALQGLIDRGQDIDLVVAIGPPIMMKFVAETTRPYAIKTLVSLNTIMVDGTGMCGGCRVSVSGKSHFVCVDGPEFDAHEVDFDEMLRRQNMYHKAQHQSMCLLNQKRESHHG